VKPHALSAQIEGPTLKEPYQLRGAALPVYILLVRLVGEEGHRWQDIPHKSVADALGYTVRSVRRGIRQLSDGGYLNEDGSIYLPPLGDDE
jgi:hypothetical protein